jgi:hypothetical protein
MRLLAKVNDLEKLCIDFYLISLDALMGGYHPKMGKSKEAEILKSIESSPLLA